MDDVILRHVCHWHVRVMFVTRKVQNFGIFLHCSEVTQQQFEKYLKLTVRQCRIRKVNRVWYIRINKFDALQIRWTSVNEAKRLSRLTSAAQRPRLWGTAARSTFFGLEDVLTKRVFVCISGSDFLDREFFAVCPLSAERHRPCLHCCCHVLWDWVWRPMLELLKMESWESENRVHLS